ncbi:hypothetical protein V1511DRAFT_463800 [Dipodascopsis uninucleata]
MYSTTFSTFVTVSNYGSTTTSTSDFSAETNWLPTSLITEEVVPTTQSSATDTSTGPVTSSTAAALPNVIAPSGGIPSAPADSSLIQIGFTYGFNYPFIVENPLAVAQIFEYLPIGIADGLNVSADDLVMQSIVPYQVNGGSYIASIARLYVPTDLVNTLAVYIHLPTSPIYNTDSEQVNSFMNMIDPTISLSATSTSGAGDSSEDGTDGSGTSNGGSDDPNDVTVSGSNNLAYQGSLYGSNGNNTSETAKQERVVIAIAVGAVCGVIAYGVLIFFYVRRYRRKKLESQSGFGSPGMRQISPPVLAFSSSPFADGGVYGLGARDSPIGSATGNGNSASDGRSRFSSRNSYIGGASNNQRLQPQQQISQPFMSENSLGWS